MSAHGHTGLLQQQHDEIVAMVRGIAAGLTESRAVERADEIATRIEELTNKLAIHLAAEDLMLCRPMICSGNIALRKIAAQFRGDITCLQDICLTFAEDWRQGDIASRPREFISAFRAVASALAGRFELESRQVFPLANRQIG